MSHPDQKTRYSLEELMAMSDRELDALAILIMGWHRVDSPHHIILFRITGNTFCEYQGKVLLGECTLVERDGYKIPIHSYWEWQPTVDLNTAFTLQAKIANLDLMEEFYWQAKKVAITFRPFRCEEDEGIALLELDARSRTIAAILTMQKAQRSSQIAGEVGK